MVGRRGASWGVGGRVLDAPGRAGRRMARRKASKGSAGAEVEGSVAGASGASRSGTTVRAGALAGSAMLVLMRASTRREALLGRLMRRGVRADAAAGTDGLAARVQGGEYDLVLIDADLEGSVEACSVVADSGRAAPVMIAPTPTLELGVVAMRAGAVDLIEADLPVARLVERLEGALGRTRRLRDRERAARARERRLRADCRDLTRSRHELVRQVGTLATDLAAAYRELTRRLGSVSMASELNALVRQELEVEGLLRTVLEYALRRLGPTNAAIFLPSSSGDYSLGAYVNYDFPKDSAEALLGHLSCTLAPAFEGREGLVVIDDPEDLEEEIGRRTDWLDESCLAAFACRQDGECLAVVVFFRDRRQPFAAETLPALTIIQDLFGKQLARVIRTHHRHHPKGGWGMPGDEGLGDIDLAA